MMRRSFFKGTGRRPLKIDRKSVVLGRPLQKELEVAMPGEGHKGSRPYWEGRSKKHWHALKLKTPPRRENSCTRKLAGKLRRMDGKLTVRETSFFKMVGRRAGGRRVGRTGSVPRRKGRSERKLGNQRKSAMMRRSFFKGTGRRPLEIDRKSVVLGRRLQKELEVAMPGEGHKGSRPYWEGRSKKHWHGNRKPCGEGRRKRIGP
ncbi:uncharacterized protein LOC131186084 [Ahaetulla prasina]|uniref:uncharacterized protein LOC131186084 n=1 Tax=Ahaetulla prasina TaxID=499056 RepID=UPI00264880E7|nr:uncharacterized protein LOC131186084 [Ahaetulla prasina]